jgi:pyruvate-formate lyase-activating enzyme
MDKDCLQRLCSALVFDVMKAVSNGSSCRSKQAKVRMGPSGIHVFNRFSGLNILIDELVPPKKLWAVTPRHVSIALTNACDLSCAYCFAPKTPAMLKFDRVLSWLVELDYYGTLGIGFGGGEPTLYHRFADICQYAANNTNLAVTFTTHGHHLDEALLLKLKNHVHFIRLSMDGINATYSKLRQRSFEALLKKIDAIKKIAPFGINYVVNTDTFPDLNQAIELAVKFGASEILLLPEQPVNGRKGIDEKTAQALKQWVLHYAGDVRLTISEQSSEGMPTCDPFHLEAGIRGYAHIAANAVLKATSYDQHGVNIESDGIMSALNKLLKITNRKL